MEFVKRVVDIRFIKISHLQIYPYTYTQKKS